MDDDDIDALKAFLNTAFEEMNFCLPGSVVSYDGRLAVIVPDLPKQIADGRTLPPPPIHNVPVRWMVCDVQGALARITGPLKKGDGGILVFSQRSIDEWIGGSTGAPLDPRSFDINDAFFIPGVNRGTQVPASDPDNLSITYGSGGLKISPNGVTTFLGPVIFADVSTFEAPVTMAPSAPINAGGGITGQDGFTFENHEHDVPNVQSGGVTRRSGPPVA